MQYKNFFSLQKEIKCKFFSLEKNMESAVCLKEKLIKQKKQFLNFFLEMHRLWKELTNVLFYKIKELFQLGNNESES